MKKTIGPSTTARKENDVESFVSPPPSPKTFMYPSASTKVGTGTGSVPSSPRERRSTKGSSSQAVPGLPKPPRSSPADDSSQQDPSPIAYSPSSVSISSKTTIRAGVGQYARRPSFGSDPPPPLSLDATDGTAGTFKLQLLSRPTSLASPPKMSPTMSASGKTLDSAAPALESTVQQQQPIFIKFNHPPLPLPRKAKRCPLFCCFYAEFDNVVGPKICYESPLGFMEQSTDVSPTTIHKLLASNFDRILAENGTTTTKKHANDNNPAANAAKRIDPSRPDPAIKSADTVGTMPASNATSASASSSNRKQSDPFTSANARESPAATTTAAAASDSIFDSMSDFIITGNELTGNIVNLSAFNMHLLTRPTVIQDQRYERNSLLFCVGFVLRRTEDPRPFRPLLSKLALTLKRMEMESNILSNHTSREQLQPLLDRILVSLNCTQWETNLVVNNNVLNLKLFHPPKYPVSPVPDHAVPILMRRDWQVQMYDWDLAINWVVLHIDGVANARQISKKAEVDMEMVRNCLRVLKHHGVISVVDMFFYTNRYCPTKLAASMLAGHEPALLQEAAEYAIKRPHVHSIQTSTPPPYGTLMGPMSPSSASPNVPEKFVVHHHPVPVLAGGNNSVPTSPLTTALPSDLQETVTAAVSSSLLGSSLKYATFASYQSQEATPLLGSLRREDQKELKTALAELYCSFHQIMTFGDLWVALAAGNPRSPTSDRSTLERNRSSSLGGINDNRDQSSRMPYQHQATANSNTNRGSSYTRGDSIEISGSEGTREHVDATEVVLKDHYVDRLRNKSACASIDWSAIFDMFDHRRFVSFGLVHGLLDRVHNFPFLLDAPSSTNFKREKTLAHDKRFTAMDEMGALAHRVAKMMDGLHCDDHIVSVFQKPINELIALVEKVEGKMVLSTYSVTGSDASNVVG